METRVITDYHEYTPNPLLVTGNNNKKHKKYHSDD